MFPTTNFDQIYTFLSCPAKLHLKLLGARSEVERVYTRPKVNIYQLGVEGERKIAEGYEREIKLQSPKPIKITPKKIDKISFPALIQALKSEIETIAKQIELNLQQLQITISDPKLNDLSRRLKKDHGIDAILHKVSYTTTPHHFRGEVDFLGLKDDKEFIIIEAKNKKYVGKKDLAKLEYYIYGLPKGYNFTKIQEHAYELMGQLYPKNIQSYFTYVGSYNFLKSSYYKLKNRVSDVVYKDDIIEKKFREKYYSISDFLKTIPIVKGIKRNIAGFREKIDFSKDEFIDSINYIMDVLSRGVKDGILVNIRDQSIRETVLELDFNTIVRKIWAVKKNVNNGINICEKNHNTCHRCYYAIQCRATIKEGELIDTNSITSIAHHGFSKLKYEIPDLKDVLLVGDEPDKWSERAKYLMTKYYIDGSKATNHELLEPILSKSDWGYKKWYARKPRWKSLFVDAVVSKTLEKELKFWKI